MPSPNPNALEYMRQACAKSLDVKREGNEIVFYGQNGKEKSRFPCDTPTNFISRANNKPFNLISVYTCYMCRDMNFKEYVSKTRCNKDKIALISTLDKKELISYLRGEISTSDQVVEASAAAGSAATKDSTSDEKTHAKIPLLKRASLRGSLIAASSNKRARGSFYEGSSTESLVNFDDPLNLSKGKPLQYHVKVEDEDSQAQLDLNDPAEVLEHILSREIRSSTRTSILNTKDKRYDQVLALLQQVKQLDDIDKWDASLAATNDTMDNAAKAKKETLAMRIRKHYRADPIIVVPNGFSDLITMLNVQDFLEQYTYVPTSVKRQQNVKKEHVLRIKHTIDNEPVAFKVVDSVSRFTPHDWKRLCAVIVSGQQWQFKGWKWHFPVETFSKVCGVHVAQQGEPINADVKSWDVKIAMIHADKRHMDKVAVREFWDHLTSFLKNKLMKE